MICSFFDPHKTLGLTPLSPDTKHYVLDLYSPVAWRQSGDSPVPQPWQNTLQLRPVRGRTAVAPGRGSGNVLKHIQNGSLRDLRGITILFWAVSI